MNIAGIQHSIQTCSLEIYVSGCDGFCEGCCNPELWDYSVGENYKDVFPIISKKIKKLKNIRQGELLRWVWILGGEPLLQDKSELLDLLNFLSSFSLPLLLFTRFEISEIPQEIQDKVDLIKSGPYDHRFKCDNYYKDGIKLATSNQQLFKF